MKYSVFEIFPGSFEKVSTGICLNLSGTGTFNLAEGDHLAAAPKADFSPLFPFRSLPNKTRSPASRRGKAYSVQVGAHDMSSRMRRPGDRLRLGVDGGYMTK